MNNFTKEELEKILNCVNFTCWEYPCEDEKLTEIRLKLNAMIGNYSKPEEPIYRKYIFKAEDVFWLIKKSKR